MAVETVKALDSGWYDSTGQHYPDNTSYYAGDYGGNTIRNFLIFNLPTTQLVTGARLRLNTHQVYVSSGAASETYELKEVVTPTTTLQSGGSGKISIFNDLGDGATYGSRMYTKGDASQIVEIELNTAALAAINASRGKTFAMGGLLTSLNNIPAYNEEAVFWGSYDDGSIQLILTTDTPPSNTPPSLTGTKATLAAGSEDTNYLISAADLREGFTDVDGDTLSVANLTATNGTLVNNNNDTWSFTPAANYNGSVNLSYDVTDGNDGTTAATQSFTLAAVNDAPTATDDQASTSKGTAVTVELSDNVSDIEDLTGAALKTTDAVGGEVTLIDSDARLITFTPNTVGTSSFKYTITDAGGLASNAATVTVNVGDVISTGNQSQNITGNEGNDVVSAGNGKDTISGLGGADVLAGNNGVDTINGGDGNDTVTGGNGGDLLTGGSGSDQFVLAKGAGTDTISDFVAGTDVIGLAGGISFDSLSLSGSNIILTASNETLASLTGVNTSTLTSANFVTV